METIIHVAQNYPFPSLIKILRKITTLYIKCNFPYSSECYVLAFKAFVNVMQLTVSIVEGTDERIINLNKVVVLRRKLNPKIKKNRKIFLSEF